MLSGEVDKHFETIESLYIYNNNKMQRLKKDKDFILKLLFQQKDKINVFIEENLINFKNKADIIKLFNYYNSLP